MQVDGDSPGLPSLLDHERIIMADRDVTAKKSAKPAVINVDISGMHEATTFVHLNRMTAAALIVTHSVASGGAANGNSCGEAFSPK